MESKILQVFYGNDALPYKDKERTVHYPIVGNGFQGANNTTQVKFYFSFLGDSSVTWVAVSKLPNGKIGSKVLQTYNDSELGEPYALLELDSFYTQYKGDIFISLQGYQGGVQVEYDSESELYVIHGTPTIQATGSVKFTNNYATQFVGSGETSNVNFQRILADLGTKLGIRAQSEHVEELPSVGQNDIFYVVNDDPNDPNLQNIYVWNENTRHYIWVGDNTLDLGDYYTQEQGEQFEQDVRETIGNGSPKGVYATLAALQAAYPTGTNGIYVVSANGHWYYWNGSAWTDGGTYQSTEIEDNSIENRKISPNLRLETILNNVNYVVQPFREITVNYGESFYIGFLQTLTGNVKISFDVVCSGNFGQLNINGTTTLSILGVKQRKSVTLNNYTGYNVYFRGYTSGVTFEVSNINVSYDSDNVEKFSILKDIDDNARNIADVSNAIGKKYFDITNDLSFNIDGFFRYLDLSFNASNDVKTAFLKVYKDEQYRISGNSYYNANLYIFYGETDVIAFPNTSNNTLYTNQVINITGDGYLVLMRVNSQASNFKLEKYTFEDPKKLPTFDEYYENQELTSISNGYMKIDGTVDTGTGKYVAISVIAGEKYKVYTNHGSNLRSYVLLDENNNVVSYYPSGSISTVMDITTIEIPVNGTLYVNTFSDKVLSVAKKVDIRDLKSNNPLYNKSILFFGDSITASRYSWGNTFEIRNRNHMSTDVCNHSVSGSQFCINGSSDTNNNINMKVKSICSLSEYDGVNYVILSGGANDVARHNTLGSLTSGYADALDTSTFYGSLEDIAQWLIKNKLNCKIGFVITPRIGESSLSSQQDFVNAIKNVCQKYAIPYIDLYSSGGLSSVYYDVRNECYIANTDYFHPNKKGYALLNNKVEQFIKSL